MDAIKIKTKRARSRIAQVRCADAASYRWLLRCARGATALPDGSFKITDESLWALSLAAACGHEQTAPPSA
jgi:hypothetical protein